MITSFKAYSTHLGYWSIIISTVVMFGALLGTVCIDRLHTMQKLTLIDVSTKEDLQHMVEHNDVRIKGLDSRITVIEKKLDVQPTK